uniref:Uncharacterized protein n=1 Tax=Arundo donax TaxID=35708 RepID=A0A0A9BVY6_ARUDO
MDLKVRKMLNNEYCYDLISFYSTFLLPESKTKKISLDSKEKDAHPSVSQLLSLRFPLLFSS